MTQLGWWFRLFLCASICALAAGIMIWTRDLGPCEGVTVSRARVIEHCIDTPNCVLDRYAVEEYRQTREEYAQCFGAPQQENVERK